MDEVAELKKLNIKLGDILRLVAMRAAYVMQLMVTISGGGMDNNLRSMFATFRTNTTCVNRLVDLDGCLFSLETMNCGWNEALTSILRTGTLDVRSVLKSSNVKPITSLGKSLLGEKATDGGSTSKGVNQHHGDISDGDAVLSWQELMTFGSDSVQTPPADMMIIMQLRLQAELLSIAHKGENHIRHRIMAHCKMPSDGTSSGTSRKSSGNHNITCDVLFEIDEANTLEKAALKQSKFDEKAWTYNLPPDFKLYFFGVVGVLGFVSIDCASHCFGMKISTCATHLLLYDVQDGCM